MGRQTGKSVPGEIGGCQAPTDFPWHRFPGLAAVCFSSRLITIVMSTAIVANGKTSTSFMKLLRLGAAALNLTPLDWQGNHERILCAIEAAREAKVSALCLPELAITGYGCEDAFFSADLESRARDELVSLAPETKGLLVAVGVPIALESALYDCACVFIDGEIAGLAAKRFLSGDGIHYEPRWFKPWPKGKQSRISLGDREVPIGDCIFDVDGVRFGFEICEDAWVAGRPGAQLAAQSVDVILNPSASHFAFGKLEVRKRFVLEGSRAYGAAYVYANHLGNEAGRIIYDGGSLIASAGELVAQGARFSFQEQVLTSAVVDIDQNRLQRARLNQGITSEDSAEENKDVYDIVKSGFTLPKADALSPAPSPQPWESSDTLKEEEFTRAVSLGLFDYLRKSRSKGFVVSLSGGADSAGCAILVAKCLEFASEELGMDVVKQRLSHIESIQKLSSLNDLTAALLTTAYQGTSNSSARTRDAARSLAEGLGASFEEFEIDPLVGMYTEMVKSALDVELSWESHDISLQNIQARVRGPLVWYIANIKGALLLATSNRSEAAVGYTTMDGDTCGGLSPIAGIDKAFLLHWLRWMEQSGPQHGTECRALPILNLITAQAPTAELRPLESTQTDEDDLMPYPVLDYIERLAIRDKLSPLEVYTQLRVRFTQYEAPKLKVWVVKFFRLWSRNQWKRERYAPSFHLDDENLDPKTWCRFPILSGGFEKEIAELQALKD